jgi:hypothetical protein
VRRCRRTDWRNRRRCRLVVPRGVAAPTRELEVEDGSLEPEDVEAVHADAEELAVVGEAEERAMVEGAETTVEEHATPREAEAVVEENSAVDEAEEQAMVVEAESDAEWEGRQRGTRGRAERADHSRGSSRHPARSAPRGRRRRAGMLAYAGTGSRAPGSGSHTPLGKSPQTLAPRGRKRWVWT